MRHSMQSLATHRNTTGTNTQGEQGKAAAKWSKATQEQAKRWVFLSRHQCHHHPRAGQRAGRRRATLAAAKAVLEAAPSIIPHRIRASRAAMGGTERHAQPDSPLLHQLPACKPPSTTTTTIYPHNPIETRLTTKRERMKHKQKTKTKRRSP